MTRKEIITKADELGKLIQDLKRKDPIRYQDLINRCERTRSKALRLLDEKKAVQSSCTPSIIWPVLNAQNWYH